MVCKHCQAENSDDAKFCKNCGMPISRELVCPACGAVNTPDSNFCNQCGEPLKSALSRPSMSAESTEAPQRTPEVSQQSAVHAPAETPVAPKQGNKPSISEEIRKRLPLAEILCGIAAVCFSLLFVFFLGCKSSISGLNGSVSGSVDAIFPSVQGNNIYYYLVQYYADAQYYIENLSSGGVTNATSALLNLNMFGAIMTMLVVAGLVAVIVLATVSLMRAAQHLQGKTEKSVTPLFAATYLCYMGFALCFSALQALKVSATASGVSVKMAIVPNEATLAGLILGAIFFVAHLVCKLFQTKIDLDTLKNTALRLIPLAVLLVPVCVLAGEGMFAMIMRESSARITINVSPFLIIQAASTEMHSSTALSSEALACDVCSFLASGALIALFVLVFLQIFKLTCAKGNKRQPIGLAAASFAVSVAYAVFTMIAIFNLIKGESGSDNYYTVNAYIAVPIVVIIFGALNLTAAILFKYFKLNGDPDAEGGTEGGVQDTTDGQQNKPEEGEGKGFRPSTLKKFTLFGSLAGAVSVLFSLIFVFFLGSNWNIGGFVTPELAEQLHFRLPGHDVYYFLGKYYSDVQVTLDQIAADAGRYDALYNSLCATSLNVLGIIMAVIGCAVIIAVCILSICSAVRLFRRFVGKTEKSAFPLVSATYFTYLGGALFWNAMLQTNFSLSGTEANASAELIFNGGTLAGLILGGIFWLASAVLLVLSTKELAKPSVWLKQLFSFALVALLFVPLFIFGSLGTFGSTRAKVYDPMTTQADLHLGPLQLFRQMAIEYAHLNEIKLNAGHYINVAASLLSVLLMATVFVLIVVQQTKILRNAERGGAKIKGIAIALLVITVIYGVIAEFFSIYFAATGDFEIYAHTSMPDLVTPIAIFLCVLLATIAAIISQHKKKAPPVSE